MSAFILFTISILIDTYIIYPLSDIKGIYVFEEILKFLGLYYWLIFFGKHSFKKIKNIFE